MPALHKFTIAIFNKCGESEPFEHSEILPHQVFHTLYEHGREAFWKIMGSPDDLLEFWRGAAELNDGWYRNHPVVQRVGEPHRRVAFGFLGMTPACTGKSRCWLLHGALLQQSSAHLIAGSFLQC